jgi:hypothetical protein
MNEQEIIERKIFLKRQLIELTEKEIERLKDSLNVPSFILEKATESISAQ